MHITSFLKRVRCGWITLGLVLVLLVPSSVQAQSSDVYDPYFFKAGVGISDYTGDFPIQSFGHPLDFQEFTTGSGLPILFDLEAGHRLSRNFALAFGLQVGNYPIVGYAGPTTSDSWRYTPQLLGRYTFTEWSESLDFYLDGGVNLTFGGDTDVGGGPSIGGGAKFPLNDKMSFYVESRFNFTLPDDGIDGAKNIADSPSSPRTNDPKGSSTGPFDSVNQLLGFGLQINFGGPDDPAPVQNERAPARATADAQSTASKPDVSEAAQPDTTHQGESVRIPSGTFIMGLTDADPLSLQNAGRKRVTVSSIYVDQHEVSNADYRQYLEQLSPEERSERLPDSTAWTEARSQESWETYFRSDFFSDYPVLGVTWAEAQAYCEAQNKRLPTEAEWEYAARGGFLGRIYPWAGISTRGSEGDYLANFNPSEGYAADGYAFTAPVDAFPPNNWGLYNVAGNVAEWTQDAYTPSYDPLSDFNPHFVDENEPRRVVRGGAWNANTFSIGVGVRDSQPRDEASVSIGFRCVQDIGVLERMQNTSASPNAPGETPQSDETTPDAQQ